MATFFPGTPIPSSHLAGNGYKDPYYPDIELAAEPKTSFKGTMGTKTIHIAPQAKASSDSSPSLAGKILSIVCCCFCCLRPSKKKKEKITPEQNLSALSVSLMQNPYLDEPTLRTQIALRSISQTSASTLCLPAAQSAKVSPISSVSSGRSSPLSCYSLDQKIYLWRTSPLKDPRLLDLESTEALILQKRHEDLSNLHDILVKPHHASLKNSLSREALDVLEEFSSSQSLSPILGFMRSQGSFSSSRTSSPCPHVF